MTKEEAIKLSETKFWEDMPTYDVAMFQLWEDKLCMPFSVFHEALEKALGRPVWTHELGLNVDGLKEELLGLRPKPSMDDIVNLIPADKRIVISI